MSGGTFIYIYLYVRTSYYLVYLYRISFLNNKELLISQYYLLFLLVFFIFFTIRKVFISPIFDIYA